MLHAHEHVHFNSDDFRALHFSCGFAAVILRNWKTHKCNLIVSFCSRHILCTCIKITQQIQRDFCSPPMEERNETFYSIDGKLKRRSGLQRISCFAFVCDSRCCFRCFRCQNAAATTFQTKLLQSSRSHAKLIYFPEMRDKLNFVVLCDSAPINPSKHELFRKTKTFCANHGRAFAKYFLCHTSSYRMNLVLDAKYYWIGSGCAWTKFEPNH